MSYLSVHPTGNQDRHGGNQKETERFLVESKQRSELGRMAQLVEHNLAKVGVAGSSPVLPANAIKATSSDVAFCV